VRTNTVTFEDGRPADPIPRPGRDVATGAVLEHAGSV
jgi:hypothetical protein